MADDEVELKDRPNLALAGSTSSAAASNVTRKSIFQDEEHMAAETVQEQLSSAIEQDKTDKNPGGLLKEIKRKVGAAVKKGMTGTENISVPKQVLQQPQIMLEVINSRVATIVIALTYLAFGLGFGLDCWTTIHNLQTDESTPLAVMKCSELRAQNISLANSHGSWGCVETDYTPANPNPTWEGLYADVYGVVSVGLLMTESNFTLPASQQYLMKEDIYLQYNVDLWACFHKLGCENDFDLTTDQNNNAGPQWQRVLSMVNQKQKLILKPVSTKNGIPATVSSSFQFFSVFQNQEALPTNSPIKSYYVKVTFLDPLSRLAIESASYEKTTTFTLEWDHRQEGNYNTVSTILQMVFFFGSLVTLVVFCVCVNRYRTQMKKKWLTEQKWFVVYVVAVLLSQNPVYLIENFMEPDAAAALVAFICSFFAQAMFLVVWLFYADSINQYSYDWKWFYLPKVGYGLALFVTSAIMIAYQFPSFTVGTRRSPVLASYNWPVEEKDSFVVTSIAFIALYMLWSVIWIVRLVLTYRQLNALSYMATRYQQLLFRFFVLQASLVAFYFIAQYTLAIYLIGHKHIYDYNSDSLSDGINILFRQQTQLFGKTMFLTVYAGILGFLLLPADCMDSELGALVSQQFALDEKELQEIIENRSFGIGADRPNTIFCVESALSMLEVSCDSYGDSVSTAKEDLDKSIADMLITHGYTFIESVVDLEYDCLCVVARHATKNTLVVAYRGTQSKKNMADNLNYRKQYMDFENMPMPDLDKEDDLDPIKFVPLETSAEEHKDETHRDQSIFSWSNFNPFGPKKKPSDWKEEGSENHHPTMPKKNTLNWLPQRWLDPSSSHPPMSRTSSASSTDESSLEGIAKRRPVANLREVIGAGGDKIADVFKSVEEGFVEAAAVIGIDLKTQTVGIHRGFLAIYMSMREGMHRIVRRELKANPAEIYITGHSMGGACASLCALDITLNTLPRVRDYLDSIKDFREVKVIMYNFGSPRVGDRNFRKLFNKTCPSSFRVVVDGDVVTGVPKNLMGFKHACLQVLIDATGFGNMIIGPSFVERWLRLRKGFSVAAHLMSSYRDGLASVVRTTKLVRELHARYKETGGDIISDPTKLDEFVKDLINTTSEAHKAELAMRTRTVGEWASPLTQHGLAGFPLVNPDPPIPIPSEAVPLPVPVAQPDLESASSELRDTFEQDMSFGISPRVSSVHAASGLRGSQDFVEAISRGSFDTKVDDDKCGGYTERGSSNKSVSQR